MKDAIGSPLFYTLLTFVITGAVRSLKTTPIPKSVLPWVALVLGYGLGLTESLTAGHSWGVAALDGLKGLASGTGAIATNETLSTLVRAIPVIGPALADGAFGKKAGPSGLPANVATISVEVKNPPKPETLGETLTKDTVVAPRPSNEDPS